MPLEISSFDRLMFFSSAKLTQYQERSKQFGKDNKQLIITIIFSIPPILIIAPFMGFYLVAPSSTVTFKFIYFALILGGGVSWILVQKKFLSIGLCEFEKTLPIKPITMLLANLRSLFYCNNAYWYILLSPIFVILVQPIDAYTKTVLLAEWVSTILVILLIQLSIICVGKILRLLLLYSILWLFFLLLQHEYHHLLESFILLMFISFAFCNSLINHLSKQLFTARHRVKVVDQFVSISSASSILKLWLGSDRKALYYITCAIFANLGLLVLNVTEGQLNNHDYKNWLFSIFYILGMISIFSIGSNMIRNGKMQCYFKFLPITRKEIVIIGVKISFAFFLLSSLVTHLIILFWRDFINVKAQVYLFGYGSLFFIFLFIPHYFEWKNKISFFLMMYTSFILLIKLTLLR